MAFFKNVPQRMKSRGVGGDYGANRFGVALDEWRVAGNLALEEGGNHGRQRQR